MKREGCDRRYVKPHVRFHETPGCTAVEEPHAQLARQHRKSFDHHKASGTPSSTRFSCNTCRIAPSITTERRVDTRTGTRPAFKAVSVSCPRSPGTPASRLTTVTCLV